MQSWHCIRRSTSPSSSSSIVVAAVADNDAIVILLFRAEHEYPVRTLCKIANDSQPFTCVKLIDTRFSLFIGTWSIDVCWCGVRACARPCVCLWWLMIWWHTHARSHAISPIDLYDSCESVTNDDADGNAGKIAKKKKKPIVNSGDIGQATLTNYKDTKTYAETLVTIAPKMRAPRT